MDVPSKITEPSATVPRRKRPRVLRIILAAVMIAALACITLRFSNPPDTKLTWLTPAGLVNASQPGPLTHLKSNLGRLLGPLNRYIQSIKKKHVIQSDSQILKLSVPASARLNLAVPVSTNADGMRAWILSPTELATFRQRLKALPDASPLSSPKVTTTDGVQSQMSIVNTAVVAGQYVSVGLTVDLNARLAGDHLKLIVGITDTDTNSAAPANLPGIKTNFAFACRASVPDSGALVIDGGGTGEKHYWLILSSMLVDATGKPIKH